MRDGEVLLVTDVQNDSCSGGRLAVPGGDEVAAVINRLASQFRHVVLRYSAEDAAAHGFDTIVIEEACRAIDLAGSAAATKASFRDRGIKLR